MFMQKFRIGLRFLGILSTRILLGVIAGFLWLVFSAFVSRTVWWIVGKFAYRDIDGSYNSIAEASQRYDSLNASAYALVVDIVAWSGVWICLAIGILWGFSQGRLDLRNWLRRKHV